MTSASSFDARSRSLRSTFSCSGSILSHIKSLKLFLRSKIFYFTFYVFSKKPRSTHSHAKSLVPRTFFSRCIRCIASTFGDPANDTKRATSSDSLRRVALPQREGVRVLSLFAGGSFTGGPFAGPPFSSSRLRFRSARARRKRRRLAVGGWRDVKLAMLGQKSKPIVVIPTRHFFFAVSYDCAKDLGSIHTTSYSTVTWSKTLTASALDSFMR